MPQTWQLRPRLGEFPAEKAKEEKKENINSPWWYHGMRKKKIDK